MTDNQRMIACVESLIKNGHRVENAIVMTIPCLMDYALRKLGVQPKEWFYESSLMTSFIQNHFNVIRIKARPFVQLQLRIA